MATKRLGKGLEALIRPQGEETPPPAGTNRIPLKDIQTNPLQPRKNFDPVSLQELTASIKEKGVITPVTVREMDGDYILVAGERRWRAAQMAGLKSIPAYIIEVTDEADMMEVALIENIQRENLNPIEEAEAYALLQSQFGLSQENIATAVGKKRATVANALRLLKLPTQIRASVQTGEISAGHGRAILAVKTQKAMMSLWKRILKKDLSVRGAEAAVKAQQDGQKKTSRKSRRKMDPAAKELEDELISILGTKVRLNHKGQSGGTITMDYYSEQDLERLLELLRSIE